jgi:hypothetical protein
VYNSVPLHLGLLWLPVVHQLLFWREQNIL